jgi:hypothetical protein
VDWLHTQLIVGLLYDQSVRAALVASGAIGGLTALMVPRVGTTHQAAGAGSG